MTGLMLAAVNFGAMGIVGWAIAIVVIAGVVAIVAVILKQMGVAIPPFIITVLWVCVAVVIGVVAIKFIASLL